MSGGRGIACACSTDAEIDVEQAGRSFERRVYGLEGSSGLPVTSPWGRVDRRMRDRLSQVERDRASGDLGRVTDGSHSG